MVYDRFSTSSFSSASAARDVRLVADGREIVGEAVDLVDQALPLFRAVTVFRYDRVLVLVEPVDHPDCVPPTIAET
jgi:hypothetical protein